MRVRCSAPAWASAVAAVLAAIALFAGPLTAQTSKTLLTAWGDPDLQGVWDFRSLTPMERPSNLDKKATFTNDEAAAFAEESIKRRSRDSDTSGRVVPYNDFWFDEGTKVTTDRTSLIVDPPDGKMPPLTPQAEKRRAAQREARKGIGADEPRPGGGVEDLGTGVRCIAGFNSGPPMTPSAYNNNVQVFQSKGYVAILTEMVHEARIVPIEARPHAPQHIRQWLGDSRGRWEGQTLVIDTTNFRGDRTPFNSTATAHLVERLTRVKGDTLLYDVTVEDPATWTKPWTFRLPMAKSNGHLYEYACHEGNYGLYNILAGVALK